MDEIEQGFSSVGNGRKLHRTKGLIMACKQDDNEMITEYYGRLKKLWDELDKFDRQPICRCGGCKCDLNKQLDKKRDEDKLHDFLFGIHSSYSTAASSLLLQQPLPSLNRAYSTLLVQEEGRVKWKAAPNDDYNNPPGKLLVRTLKHLEKPNKIFGIEFNFHLIDLKMKKIELNYIPAIPLMNEGATGEMVAFDSCIYILDAVLNRTELNQNKAEYEDMNHIHCESSKYCLVSKRWDAFDAPIQTEGCSIPDTSIFGKLYCFGLPWRRPMAVYENGGWKDLRLPDHLIHRKISFPVIPDHINKRYLVHFYDSREIYAFRPSSNSNSTATAAGDWTCVVDNFNREWDPTVAVSGNILFFHGFRLVYLVNAYDMSTNKWLEIVGDFTRIGATVSHFSHMFTLPENHDVLCLATGLPAAVDILRLRFNHTSGSNQLTLTALDYHSYNLPIPFTVEDFLLL
ncbi:uncharacterized protein LOC141615411 [Silene latifolia]|uniref:uncharacterized protein LOC141615411 n=1 Tax=Silene latifolia TaxID=37657 RepID=UPI003D776557